MAQQKGAVHLKGKHGDITFTDGKNGARSQPSATFTEKQKKAAADQPQIKRTPGLNKIASPLWRVLNYYAGGKIYGQFWQNLLSAFREEKTNERVLLLQHIRQMDIQPDRIFETFCPLPPTELTTTSKHYVLEADISKPAIKPKDVNCYSIQFILVVWNKHDNTVRHTLQDSGWLEFNDHSPKFATLKFEKKPEDTEWLLVCRAMEGYRYAKGVQTLTGRMKLVETGTVSAASKKILEKHLAEKEAAKLLEKDQPAPAEGEKFVIRKKK